MSEKLPNMLESAIQKIREMVDVNSVVGEPIHTPDGVTIIPVSKGGENPFGGGVGGGVKVTPLCFLIIQDGNVRMMPVPVPASSTADRIVEMLPETIEKINAALDSKKSGKTGE